MNHTPTPWRISEFEQGAGGDARVVMGADGFSVAHLMDRSATEHEADAAFIVHAVNAHDDLVKASGLGEAVAASTIAFIQKVCEGGDDWLDAANKLNDEILQFRYANNAALAKAGGVS